MKCDTRPLLSLLKPVFGLSSALVPLGVEKSVSWNSLELGRLRVGRPLRTLSLGEPERLPALSLLSLKYLCLEELFLRYLCPEVDVEWLLLSLSLKL